MNKKKLLFLIILPIMVSTMNITISRSIKPLDLNKYITSSYFGGLEDDLIRDLAIDSEKNIIITGDTMSTNLNTTVDAFQHNFAGGEQDVHSISGDAFVSKFNSSGGLIWSTYLGGSSNDGGMQIVVDSSDNILVLGITNSINFPFTGSNFYHAESDIFITKLAPNGTVIYSNCIGTSGEENIEGCVIDSDFLIFTGGTSSRYFFLTDDAQDSVFGGSYEGIIVKMHTNGTIMYSSFYGGNSLDVLGAISINENGKILVNGVSTSSNLPFSDNAYSTEVSGPGRDFFISTLDSSDMSVEYCSYFGGSGADDSFGCTLDSENNFIFSGRTWSDDFPIANAYQSTYSGEVGDVGGVNAFVSKIDHSTGDLIFSSYFGGPAWDTLHHVAVDNKDNIFTCGITPTDDFPMINAFQPDHGGKSDVVLLWLSPDGTPGFGTYIGGNGNDHTWNMELLEDNNVYIVGYTNSTNFPLSGYSYQESLNGSSDGFFLKFDYAEYFNDTLPEQSTTTTEPSQTSTNLELSMIVYSIVFLSLFKKNKK